jgi:hypothetical protein
MMRFVAGLMLGLLVGSAAMALADAFTENGVLRGWSVTKDGTDICNDPFVWHRRKEIDCD